MRCLYKSRFEKKYARHKNQTSGRLKLRRNMTNVIFFGASTSFYDFVKKKSFA